MSEVREERFETAGGITVDVRLASGEVVVVPGSAGQVHVRVDGPDAGRFTVSQDGGTVWIRPGEERRLRWRGHRVVVRAPEGTALVAHTASAEVGATCALALLDVETASGDIRAGVVDGRCRITSASGEIRLERVDGDLDARSASGDVTVGRVGGDAKVHSASGDLRLGAVGGQLSARSASGDVVVDGFAGSRAEVKTTSGDVRLALSPGMGFDLDVWTMSGSVRTDFPVDADNGEDVDAGQVRVRAVSGDVHLRLAEQ